MSAAIAHNAAAADITRRSNKKQKCLYSPNPRLCLAWLWTTNHAPNSDAGHSSIFPIRSISLQLMDISGRAYGA